MLETSLYPAVKRFLEAAGYRVKGEVNGCDVVAVRAGDAQRLVIVEMKLGFNLDLLLQATDRMRAADEVWLAVPAPTRSKLHPNRAGYEAMGNAVDLGMVVGQAPATK